MSWWDSAPLAPQGPQGQPQPLIDLRDPSKQAGDARDEIRTGIAQRGEVRDANTTQFNQKDKLRADFEGLAPVKEYRAQLGALSTALQTAPNASGDNALIYAYAKIMDPASVVRESEMVMAASGDSAINALGAKLEKEFGIEGGGQLSEQVRERLRLEALKAVGGRAKLYNNQRERFSEYARRGGFDPFEVVGDHDANPFVEQIKGYAQEQNNQQDQQPLSAVGVSGFEDQIPPEYRGQVQDVFVDAQGKVSGLSFNNGEPDLIFYDNKPISQTELDQRNSLIGSIDSVVRGLADTVTLGFADEIAAAGDTIFNGGTMAGNLANQRRIDETDSQANPVLRTAGQVAGAFALPIGMAARTPAELAKVGAATGGAYGFGSGEGSLMDRTANAVPGAVIGGVGGAALGKVAEVAAPRLGRLFNRAPQAADDMPAEMSAPEFIAAAQRQNVDYLPADIPGSNTLQIATALTDNTLGSPLIQRGAEKAVASVKGAVRRETDALGGARDNAGAGQAVQKGVNAWQDSADAKIGNLYEKIPIAAGAAGDTTNTLAALREVNNPLSSNPALSAQISDPKLKAYQEALESGGLSWQDLKGFRSYLGQKIGAPSLQSDIPKDRLRAIYAGLSSDMEATAMKQGPQALVAFKRANTYKRAVETRRENVMGLLLGKNLDMSPEKTFQQMQSWGKKSGGDFAKLSQAIRSLPEEEANAVRATIIDGLGKATDGAQNANGTVFSPNTFATQWNKLSPRAKAVLFQGDHRAALDDIAGISYAMKAADKYNNTSRTGLTVGAGGTLLAAGSDVVTGGLALLGQAGMGAILGSPRMAKWAAALYKKPNAKAVEAHIARLDNLAKAEPVIANEIFQLQTRLRDAFGQGQMPLAANQGEEKRTPLPLANTTTAGEPQ